VPHRPVGLIARDTFVTTLPSRHFGAPLRLIDRCAPPPTAHTTSSPTRDVKDKAEELVDKVGDKLPDSVTDKIEKIIPGDRDGDGN
jgi:hypothetical protein